MMSRLVAARKKTVVEPSPYQDLGDPLRFASNPASDSDYLGYFARTSKDPAVLAALARNPNTPLVRLGYLWEKDPQAILENPIVMLWDFTKPGSAKKKVPREAQYILYQHLLAQPEFDPRPEIIDEEWVAYFLERPRNIPFALPFHAVVRDGRLRIRLSLLRTCVKYISEWSRRAVEFPHHAIEVLANDSSSEVAEALAMAIGADWLRPDPLDMAFLAHIARLLMKREGGAGSLAPHVAKWPCLDADLIEGLARDADEKLLAILAAHPKASESFQERMASHSSELVRAGLAASTPIDSLIRQLATDANPSVRASLATSRHLTPEIQSVLFANKDSRIILGLLENPLTIPELIRAIGHLPHLSITDRLRNHPNTPPDILAILPRPCSPYDPKTSPMRGFWDKKA